MVTTVVSSAPGSNCPAASHDAACTATVTDLIPGLTITDAADAVSVTPGSTVRYTVTVDNTGQTSYHGAVVASDLTGVLGSAAYNGDATATAGALSYASPALTWTGDLAPGDVVTITYTVTVDNPLTGGTILTSTVSSAATGSSCPAGAGGPCTVATGIVAGPLTITAPVTADLGSGPPGGTITSNLGPVQVTDDRGFGADWDASVSSSDFSAGGAAQTIPVSDTSYGIAGLGSVTGSASFRFAPATGLSATPQGVVNATGVNGNTSVTWDPVIQVHVPGGAVGGTYSGTIVHSVS
jgi:hypothetical protein